MNKEDELKTILNLLESRVPGAIDFFMESRNIHLTNDLRNMLAWLDRYIHTNQDISIDPYNYKI